MIAAGMIVFTIVAVLVLFADMFSVGPDFGFDRGSAYSILFCYWVQGNVAYGYNPTVLLIIAWCLECLAFLVLCVGIFFSGKVQGILIGAAGAMLLIGAILFFCAIPIYQAAQGDLIKETFSYGFYLGAAPICNGIFAGLAGLLGIYACYTTLKAA